jgi:hypothetical protein
MQPIIPIFPYYSINCEVFHIKDFLSKFLGQLGEVKHYTGSRGLEKTIEIPGLIEYGRFPCTDFMTNNKLMINGIVYNIAQWWR